MSEDHDHLHMPGTAASVGNAGCAESLIAKVWDYSLGSVVNFILLSRNAEALTEEMEILQELRKDLERNMLRIKTQVENQLSGWMTRVNGTAEDVDSFQRFFEGRSFCISGFTLGPKAAVLLTQVRRLSKEGELLFRALVQLAGRRTEVNAALVPSEASTSSSNMVGAEKPLQRIKDYIMDEGVGIIGVCGMAGVGKTALLKIIKNDFWKEEACRCKYDVAIWVSREEAEDIHGIQKIIADSLGIPSDYPRDRDTLFSELCRRRFLLFLDDVWEKLDLMEIGLPLPKIVNNKSKILFTTRSEKVCREMDADEIMKVVPLKSEKSWELFCSKFEEEDTHCILDDPIIQPLAKKIVKKCGGLPISLITVGRVMATQAKTIDDWREAMTKLYHCPAEFFSGMENEVLQLLKLSYDKLKSKILQDCLLYLALFPEDSYIEKKEIIDYWICEGFLDSEEFDEPDIEDTRRRARKLITELQNACLLEVDDELQFVRLHVTVRDMALWISRHQFVVLAGSNWVIPELSTWKNATRISLINNTRIRKPASFDWNLHCPNLTTLLLTGSRLAGNIQIRLSFFTYTGAPSLKVLDLAHTGIQELPIGITLLTSLRYLCLKGNNLISIPLELGNLINLRVLILSDNKHLRQIPLEALIRLSNLQVLNMSEGSPYFRFLPCSEVDDLNCLKSLCEGFESPVLKLFIRNLEVHREISSDLSPSLPKGHTICQQMKMPKRLKRLSLSGRDEYFRVKGGFEFRSDQLRLRKLFVSGPQSFINTRAIPIAQNLRYLMNKICKYDRRGFLNIETYQVDVSSSNQDSRLVIFNAKANVSHQSTVVLEEHKHAHIASHFIGEIRSERMPTTEATSFQH